MLDMNKPAQSQGGHHLAAFLTTRRGLPAPRGIFSWMPVTAEGSLLPDNESYAEQAFEVGSGRSPLGIVPGLPGLVNIPKTMGHPYF